MKTTLNTLHSSILGVSAALLMPFVAAAAGPSGGPFTNTVTGPTNAVWDFGGIIDNVDIDATQHSTEVQASIATDFTQSGKGKVNGSEDSVPVTLNIIDSSNPGTVPLSTTVTEKGSINSTGGGSSHLVFTVTATGTGTIPGESQPSKIILKKQINATIDSAALTVTGTQKDSASASGVGSVTETTSFTNTIAEVGGGDLGDGSWQLILDSLSTVNNQVTGTATITLNSGQVFNYTVKGSFNATKGTKLVLTGSDAISLGSAIQVTLDTGNVVRNIKGRITGQLVNASF